MSSFIYVALRLQVRSMDDGRSLPDSGTHFVNYSLEVGPRHSILIIRGPSVYVPRSLMAHGDEVFDSSPYGGLAARVLLPATAVPGLRFNGIRGRQSIRKYFGCYLRVASECFFSSDEMLIWIRGAMPGLSHFLTHLAVSSCKYSVQSPFSPWSVISASCSTPPAPPAPTIR